MNNTNSAPEPQDTTTTSAPKRKRGGIRKPNQYPDKNVVYVITEVGPGGDIRKPEKMRARFRNSMGALVRDQLNPAIPSWPEIPDETKRGLWNKLLVNFKFPSGTEKAVKRQAFRTMGEIFRRWRCELNTKYIQQGTMPFHKYGNITQSQ